MSLQDTLELINLGVTFILFLVGIGVLITFRKVSPELLKAKMFLKKDVIKTMWIYSMASGVTLILHEATLAYEHFFNKTGLSEITLLIFVAAFTILTYSWYTLLKESVQK